MTTTAQIKERPVLFSTPMIRAILNGEKTQTRRVVKPQPIERPLHAIHPGNDRHVWYQNDGPNLYCPYGQPGDLLWVRETWSEYFYTYGAENTPSSRTIYRADGLENVNNFLGWKPSIHMPRWASRITLRITDIRVERVQEISEADAAAEGAPETFPGDSYPMQFARLWDSINEKRGYGWASNPWVWCISFEVVKP